MKGIHHVRQKPGATCRRGRFAGVTGLVVALAWGVSSCRPSVKPADEEPRVEPVAQPSAPPPQHVPAVAPVPMEPPAPSKAAIVKPRGHSQVAPQERKVRGRRELGMAEKEDALAQRKKAVVEKQAIEVLPSNVAAGESPRDTSIRQVVMENRQTIVDAIAGRGVKFETVHRLILDPLVLSLLGKYNNDARPISHGSHEFRLADGVFVPRAFLREIALGSSPLVEVGRIDVQKANLGPTGFVSGATTSYSVDDINSWITPQIRPGN